VLAICWLGLALWVLGLLRSLIGALRAGRPFVAANASRVRSIGWAVIIGEIYRVSVVYFENRYAMTHFAAQVCNSWRGRTSASSRSCTA
jgi:hypothetical protein